MDQARSRVKRAVVFLVALASIGYAAVTLLAFVPKFPLTMLEHFRLQYAIAGVVVVAIAHRSRAFDVALIAMLINLAIVAPDLGTPAHAKAGTRVRVLFANVLASNTQYDAVAKLIADTHPDVVALVETRDPWFTNIAPALAGYARLEHPREDNFALGLYVKGELTAEVRHVGGTLPTIFATVTTKGVTMSFVLTHLWPPVSAWAEAQQWQHMAALSHHVRALPAPIVFAGDFNATPWSRIFRRVIGTTGLCDTRAGFGYQGSYPASSAILRIPIDHVLVSCDIGVMDRTIERDIGSDHLPVRVDLAF